MTAESLSVAAILILAWGFDFTNGFHDSANSVSTIVATRVLTPKRAVFWAAGFNFIAFLVFHTAVANTVGQTVSREAVSEAVIFAGLAGAITWNLLTWWFALPTSSSHAIIGAFAGAGIAKAGGHVIKLASIEKTVIFIFLSPAVGLLLAFILLLLLTWLVRHSSPRRVQGHFRRFQLLSAAAVSLGHGGNDAQKTMGIVSALLVGTGYLHGGNSGALPVPLWVVLFAHSAIALGTLSGGWRIVRTLGGRLTDLKPISGFAAETAAGAALVGSTILGAPVSTTHAVTGAITGVGTVQRRSAVRWPVAGRIASSWILTIPVAGVLGATAYRTTLAFTTFTTGVAASAALAGLAVLMVLSGRGRPKSVANEPRRPTPTAA